MSRKNPRFRLCKVQTIIPNSTLIDLEQDHHLEHRHVVKTLCDSILDNRKNSDDNTSLIQKQIDSLRSYVEKCFLLLFAVLFLDGLIQILS